MRQSQEPPSETQLEEFFDLSVDVLCIVGFDGTFTRVNAAFARAMGMTKEELLARSALDITHPDDVQPAVDALSRLAEGEDLVGYESRVIAADGTVRWLEWNTRAAPERGVVYGVARDTTERRRADADLQEAQRLLEASRDELRALAEEQSALQRVATLVASGAPADETFAAVGREVGALLGADGARVVRFVGDEVDQLEGWTAPGYGPLPTGHIERFPGSLTDIVHRTGRPARMDGYADDAGPVPEPVRALDIRSAVGAPILVEGRLWGALLAWLMHPARLPDTAEPRLAGFTRLLATALSNSANRAELERVLAEQAALRRVATLVARETPPSSVFAAVGREVGELFGVDATHLGRFDPGDTVASVAQWGRYPDVAIGARFPLEGDSISARVSRTGRPARMDGYDDAPGPIAETVRGIGIRWSLGVPISVGGRTWGVMILTSKGSETFPADTESRLQDFTELVAAAIANAGAHARVRALADEQAALRRVATLVARQTPQSEVFAAIAEEIGRLLAVDSIEMIRYEEGRLAAVVASSGPITDVVPVGTRVPLESESVVARVFHTARPERLDAADLTGAVAERRLAAGVHSVVGAPITVEGRVWGAMLAIAHDAPLAPGTESRIGQFTDLMATAIANAEARAQVARLADEQAALRRVATLVAQGAPPAAVFDAVTREVAKLLGASAVALARYDGDALIVLANRATITPLQVGDRVPLEDENLASLVRRTGRPARQDESGEHAEGRIAEILREAGIRSTVAAPVVVEGRTWGVLAASWVEDAPREDTEQRMAGFAELLDTAIANADSRDQLTASRARVLAAGDDARRRVVRDLHDGAQQRLVHTIVTLKLARLALRQEQAEDDPDALLAEALANAEETIADLRELSHGILPAALTRGGLRAGVDEFASWLDLPVHVDVSAGRLPRDIEASAYFIIAEALTNVAKHARATEARVSASVEDGVLTLEVRDDGVGGADTGGHGLVGVSDRVDALGGELSVESPRGGGTVVGARLPLSSER